jgi:hypothetical protein
MREDGAGKRAKLESDGMRELKSELVSSFNDQQPTLCNCVLVGVGRRRGWTCGLEKPARPD